MEPGTVHLNQDRGDNICRREAGGREGYSTGKTGAPDTSHSRKEAWLLILTQAFPSDRGQVSKSFWAVPSWGVKWESQFLSVLPSGINTLGSACLETDLMGP